VFPSGKEKGGTVGGAKPGILAFFGKQKLQLAGQISLSQ
jgi:hypothetical protein